MGCIYKQLKWYDDEECEMICTHCDSEFYGEYPYGCEGCGLYEGDEDAKGEDE